MPVALLEGCITSSGWNHQDNSLYSFPSPSLPFQAALQTHNPHSLQIPLDKVFASITLPAAHTVALVSSDKPNTSVRQPRTLYPPHLLLCFFFWQSWEDSLPLHAQQFLLTSLSPPHYFCFPAWLPPSLNPPLPPAPLYLQLQFGPLCMDPVTPLSNHRMPCLSVISDFSPLSTTNISPSPALARPTPRGVSHESVTISPCQDSFQPSALQRGTFTAPLAVPSQHQRQRHGGC